MDGEEVSNISDTAESNQVALIVKSVYYDMLSDIDLPERDTLVQLDPSGDNAKPTLMTVPDDVIKLYSIMYDNKATADTYSNYQPVKFKDFDSFLQDQQSLREETTGVGSMTVVVNGEDYPVMYRSDRMPTYYTTIGDHTILFDSYDVTEDTTLQSAKTLCKGQVVPTFTMSNSFTPALDPTQFSYLVNRAKVRAFNEIKQMENNEAGGEARRQKIIVQKRKRKTPDAPAEVYRVSSRFGRK
jgi:hypothetical protein